LVRVQSLYAGQQGFGDTYRTAASLEARETDSTSLLGLLTINKEVSRTPARKIIAENVILGSAKLSLISAFTTVVAPWP